MPDTERFSLTGRIAVVTGASRGLGSAICTVLSAAGADIVAVGRDETALAQTQDAVTANGRRCMIVTDDVADPESADRIAKITREQLGNAHILVNNAGISAPRPLTEQTVEEWDAILNVNLRAPWLMARALVAPMIDRGEGKIINIGSAASAAALVDHGAYCASKAGLAGLTRVMAAEWAPHGIQTNAICPTIVATPMGERVWHGEKLAAFLARIPAGRIATTQDVADLAVFLASSASGMINGQEIYVDGGYTAL